MKRQLAQLPLHNGSAPAYLFQRMWRLAVRRLTDGPTLFAPLQHEELPENVNIDRLEPVIRAAHEQQPSDYTALLGAKGVGPATVRALSLLAELIYDAPASHRDPADATKLPPVLKDR